MAVRFLSEEWAKEITEALNSNDQFTQAAAGKTARVQNVVNAPDGEKKFSLVIADGQADVSVGEIEGTDATISQDYDTAASLFKGELSATAAYMSGRIRVAGDLMKLMQLQGVLAAMGPAMQDVDVEY